MILIVEDNQNRIDYFKQFFPDADYTDSSHEAVELLKSNSYDKLSLDNDLKFNHYEKDCHDDETGYFVAQFLRDNPDNNPNMEIVVHSLNFNAQKRIKEALKYRKVRQAPCLIFYPEEWAQEHVKNFDFEIKYKCENEKVVEVEGLI